MAGRRGNPPPPERQLSRAQPQQTVIERREAYQGLIPPPVILQQFDDLIPGTAARIIQWAEDEQQHRRALEREAQDANVAAQQRQLTIAETQSRAVFKSDLIGQVLGFVVCGACVAGAIWLSLQGHEGVAIALAAIPTAAVIQAFRAGVFRKPAPPEQRKR